MKLKHLWITSLFLILPVNIFGDTQNQNNNDIFKKVWEGATWHDDYYIVGKLNDETYAISEPTTKGYYNTNYLIVGEKTAILFDSGYQRDISPIVKSLTKVPVLTLYSHLHFDHIAFIQKQKNIGMISLPYLRDKAKGNKLKLSLKDTLTFPNPEVTISKWIEPNETIDLGGRTIKVLYTPGHTDASISLLDEKNKYLFTGDFLFDPMLDYVGHVPGFNEELSIKTALKFKRDFDDSYKIHGGHGFPEQPFSLTDKFINLLKSIRDGKINYKIEFSWGSFVKRYELNGMQIVYPLYGGSILGQWGINLLILFFFLSFIALKVWRKSKT